MPAIQDIYSINVSNRYDLGAAEDAEEESDTAPDYDPLDTLKSLEEQKKRAQEEAKKKKAMPGNKAKNQKKAARFQEIKESNIPAKKEEPPKAPRPPRRREEGAGGNRRGGERQNFPEGDENRRPPRRRNDPPRGGEGDQLKGKEEPFGTYGRSNVDVKNTRNEGVERRRGGRSGYRNMGYRGRNYGGYRNDGRDDRGKREFDRRSGSDRTSVRPTDKRDGAGPRNWGTPGTEVEETAADTTIEEVATQEQPEGETEEKEPAKEENEEEGEKEPKEEEPSQMTLDEWKAKQAAAAKAKAFNIRKAGEGENVDQWKNMKMLRKGHKDDNQAGSASKEQHKRQTKPHVDVNIHFGDNAARGFGRGRGRGQRYRSERGQKGHQMLPDVQNEQEFPTLG